MTLTAFLTIWGIHMLAAASPGPAVLMAARTSVAEGFRTGLWLAVGLGLGAAFWAAAALFGLALLFKLAPALLWGMKIAGGLFLIWTAWKMWRHAPEPMVEAAAGDMPRGPLSALWLGVTTQLANPKCAVFFGAVFVGLLPEGTSHGWEVILLAMILVNEFFCCAVVARLFSLEKTRRAYASMKTGIDRGFGGILALLGVKIAAT